MRNFLLTRARTAFWIWSAPAILALLSCAASGLKGWALLTGYLLAIAWILVGWVVINFQPRIAMRPALAALDNRCDPEPLLELCRTVCRQNPDSLLFQVYQSWALSLLGKDKEALPVLDRVANHPRLTKDALALLVWSAALPSGDPRQEWAAEKLTALKPKMRANQRALVDQVINQRRSFALMQAEPPSWSLCSSRIWSGQGACGRRWRPIWLWACIIISGRTGPRRRCTWSLCWTTPTSCMSVPRRRNCCVNSPPLSCKKAWQRTWRETSFPFLARKRDFLWE